MNLIIFNFLTI